MSVDPNGPPTVPPPASEASSTHSLVVRTYWWLNPLVILGLVVGLTATASVLLASRTYETWATPKYLDRTATTLLFTGILLCAAGILFGLQGWQGSTTRRIEFSADQLRWLRKSYRVCLGLAIFGYTMWFLIGLSGGVGLGDLAAVVQREQSAIGQLKSESRPVGGLTTWTQLGPVAVALGVILRRLGFRARGIWVLAVFAAVRTLFYAERLALLEIAIPVIVMLALTASPADRSYKVLRVAPFATPPLVWSLFAASEYTRSWVYYQTITNQSFFEWVSVRMLGYYTTAYNNSALLYRTLPPETPPYFSVDAFWNAPVVGSFFSVTNIGTRPAESWWIGTLTSGANMEFTNTGSFLVAFAEFGIVAGALIWIAIGYLYGRVYRGLLHASTPALVTYSCLLVGLLELPRFNYISLGRTTPMLIALVVLALSYPRSATASTPRTRRT